MRKCRILLLATTIAFASAAMGADSIWPLGPEADLQFETSAFMKSTEYSSPDSLSSDADSSGAYGPFNRPFDLGKSKEWYIESQRFAFDAIGAGLAWSRKDLIDRGLTILDWGFKHENADGSFSCPDTFHSTAFFIEAVARTALLLKASKFREDYGSWIADVTPKLLSSARWMANPKIAIPGMQGDAIYVHRYYLNAAALGFVGVLAKDSALIKQSQIYIREGISKQNSQGFNPEKNGYDTSYHSVGLVFALRYYSIVADSNMRHELGPMISHGLHWLKGRVRDDGSVDQAGNTRTGNGQEIGRDKKPKTMSYASAARSFAYWSQVTGDQSYSKVALKLYEYDQKRSH
jgi:hypothetical protein